MSRQNHAAVPDDLVLKELTPERWPDLERLFGPYGACAGCWCMFWRVTKQEYDELRRNKGPVLKRRFKSLVTSGRAHGVLAYAGGEPIGWCSFDRRTDFIKLNRSPSFRINDAERVWSLPCFYIKSAWRSRGVASALLAAAERAIAAYGAEIIEAYPSKVGDQYSGSSSYTGTESMFRHAGFKLAAARPSGKQRYRKNLR